MMVSVAVQHTWRMRSRWDHPVSLAFENQLRANFATVKKTARYADCGGTQKKRVSSGCSVTFFLCLLLNLQWVPTFFQAFIRLVCA